MSCLLVLWARRISGGKSASGPHHEPTDYCSLLGEDNINGLKHGFLAGNNVWMTEYQVNLYTNDKVDITLSVKELSIDRK